MFNLYGKLEKDIVVPLKLKFYRRYVDDMVNSRKINTNDILLEQLNNYHPKIKIAIELNPKKFLDMKLICVKYIYNTGGNRKATKLPIA